jgi:hypothetical protein
MDEKKIMVIASILAVLVFLMSTSVAYICFNILESSAEASLQNWKFGGAFAGFVFTALLLTSIIFQFYKQMTTDRIGKYRDKIQELQIKLIKGAPSPQGYAIEIDEKHNLVFSRPQEWLPLNGILYQYLEKRPSALFNPNFNVIYQSDDDLSILYEKSNLGKFDSANVDVAKLYESITKLSVDNLKKILPLYENASLSKETIYVHDIKSLKWIFTYTTLLQQNGKNKMRMCTSAVYTYVPRINALYEFTFSDSEENFLKSSEVFNTVVRSIRFL